MIPEQQNSAEWRNRVEVTTGPWTDLVPTIPTLKCTRECKFQQTKESAGHLLPPDLK